MSVLHVTGLKKALGAREVLHGASLRIEAGERVGCVGSNGAGKTTLLRLIQGDLAPDAGEIQIARRARLGHVEQRPRFEPGETVRAHVESGLEEVHRIEKSLEAVGEAMATADGEDLRRLVERHGELSARMDFLGGWESERRVETVLSGIGLSEALWDRAACSLSGGEKSRTALARELVSVPDLLLLDEPTNNLDLAGIEWLEAYLVAIHSAVLMVSHDRRLLDRVVGAIIEVEAGRLVRYPGNYDAYVRLKQEQYAADLRAWKLQQEHIRKEDVFIRKHMGSQRTGEAKGRRRKLTNLKRLRRPHNDVRKPRIRFAQTARGGELVVETDELDVGYGEAAILRGAKLRIGRGDRVGIVGPNGSGKTTLLEVLAGRMAPLGGELIRGHRASCGYYDQETSDLRDDGTPLSEIRRDHPRMTDEEIRSHLARFLFRGEDVDRTVSSFSGGERARLSLARLVLTGPSWLALDEPTNHLDLAGRTALEETLGAFDGTLVCISHDRAFLDGLCGRILEVADGGVRTFEGNYTDYRRHILEEEAARADARRKADVKQEGKRRSPLRTASGRTSSRPRNPYLFRKLEQTIIDLEEERKELLEALGGEEVYLNPPVLRETQVRLAEIERDLEEKNRQWERWG